MKKIEKPKIDNVNEKFLFQNLKITLMLLLVLETLGRLITCQKYLKKKVTKDLFI